VYDQETFMIIISVENIFHFLGNRDILVQDPLIDRKLRKVFI